jgi:hypothetical protein
MVNANRSLLCHGDRGVNECGDGYAIDRVNHLNPVAIENPDAAGIQPVEQYTTFCDIKHFCGKLRHNPILHCIQ